MMNDRVPLLYQLLEKFKPAMLSRQVLAGYQARNDDPLTHGIKFVKIVLNKSI